MLALQAGADAHITAEDNEAFERALSEAGVEHELVVYEGAPHSFFDRKQDEFAGASEDAWARVLEFVERHCPVIREARPDEAEALAAIQRDASLAALAHIFPPELYPYPLDDVTRRWEDSLADDEITVLVAEEDGVATGVAGCRTEWLDGLYVLPQFWSRGVGRALHDDVLDRLRGGRLRALPPLGARAQRPRKAFLRAARLGRERHLARRPVPAEARSTSATRSASRRRTGSAARSRARPPRPSRTGSARCAGRAASR